MGILDRFADRVADRLATKALPAGVAGAALPVAQDARPLIAAAVEAHQAPPVADTAATTSLPWTEPPVSFGPGIPAIPGYLDPRLPGSGRALPRRFEYPVSWNSPGQGQRLVPWKMLRDFSKQVSVVRRCIELRKNRLTSVNWTITIKADVVDGLAQDKGRSRTEIRSELTRELQPDIDRLRTFWETPDRLRRLSYTEWLAALLEDHFVIDAVSIYPHPTINGQIATLNHAMFGPGDLHSFELLDGSTIKPLIDNRGNPPQAPEKAFQQILHGFPRGEFTMSAQSDGEFTSDELVYLPFFRATDSIYGYSPVEQALTDGDLYLKRVAWIKAGYTDGSAATMYMKSPAPTQGTPWTPEQITEYNALYNAKLAGDTAERQRAQFLPQGTEPYLAPDFAERYEAAYDEHLIKLLCWPFGVMPTELGITPHAGLGGSGHQSGEADSAARNADRPYVEKLRDLLNDLSYSYLGMDRMLTFSFDLDDEDDEVKKAEADKSNVTSGLTTLNRVLADRGEPLYDFDEANEPFVMTPTGPVFLRGAMTAPEVATTEPTETSTVTDDGTTPAEDTTTAAAKAELATFAKYAARRTKSGRWRDFTFEHIAKASADELNTLGSAGDLEQIRDFDLVEKAVPKAEGPAGPNARRIVTHFAPQLAAAFGAMFDVDDIVAHADELAKAAVDPNTDELTEILQRLYSESYAAGINGATEQLGGAVDWTTWKPGHAAAAEEAWGTDTGRGLQRLLDDAGVQIKSIAQNRLDALGQLLGDSLDQGLSTSALGRLIRDELEDPSYAEMVARTETARAVTVATLDEYRASNIEQVGWLLSDDACPECEENDAASPIGIDDDWPNGDPPVHPQCLCALVPITGTSDE